MKTLVPVVTVLCLAVGAGHSHAQGRAKPPEQVLKEAGLTRFGSCYVLAGELQAGKLVKDFDQHAARLSMELQREVGLEQNLEYQAMEVGVLRQKARMSGGGSRGRGRNQSGRINREIRSIERNSVSRERRQIGTLARAATGDRKKMLQDEQSYQSLLQSTMQQYADLAGRPEIQAALHSINEGVHPKIALGPVGAYRARVQHTMMKQLTANGLRAHKGGVFEPDDVSEFTKRVNSANVLYRKLDSAPADDPRRAELTAEVTSLRTELSRLNDRATTLARIPDVRDALEELSLHAKRRQHPYHVGLGTDAEKARHILDQIDKGIPPVK